MREREGWGEGKEWREKKGRSSGGGDEANRAEERWRKELGRMRKGERE